jgi:Protein of unknown function (DUF4236)/DnaJ domain
MGLFFRKSIKAGPFRINLSKSGVGVSAGVRGARISKGPKGTYINVGRGGIYYKQKLGGVERSSNPASPEPWQAVAVDVPRRKIIEEIKPHPKKPLSAVVHWTYLALTAVSILIIVTYGQNQLSHTPEGRRQVMIMLATIPPSVWLVGFLMHRLIVRLAGIDRLYPLFYQLDQTVSARFETIKKACGALAQSKQLWLLPSQPGYSHIMGNTTPALLGLRQPPLIATNVDVWELRVVKLKMFFLPDNIYIYKDKAYSTISYDSLCVSAGERRAFLYQAAAPDTQIVDRTWRHTRKDGLPDLRYKDNPSIPIGLYGLVNITSTDGFNLILQISSVAASHQFVALMNSILPSGQRRSYQPPPRSSTQQNSQKRTGRTDSSASKTPFEILGVQPGASLEEITAAYREQARKNHPDKVANMDQEFRELAERRMKVINDAYQELKRRFE